MNRVSGFRLRRSSAHPGLLRVFLLLGMIFLPATAFAHPVIIITYHVRFIFNSQGLTGFYEQWKFDQVHSIAILDLFDRNHNGQIDPSELPALKRGYFDNLKRFSYFTSIVLNGKALPTDRVTDFSATFRNHRMLYHFFVPLRIRAKPRPQELDVTVWDRTYFTDLNLQRGNALRIVKPQSIHATIGMADDHRHFWHIAPDVVLVKALPFYLKMIVVRFSRP